MNVGNILKVAQEIESLPDGKRPGEFSMANYFYESAFSCPGDRECGSPMCIAGWTCFLLDGKMPVGQYDNEYEANLIIHRRARELLGISRGQADRLFTPNSQLAGTSYMIRGSDSRFVSAKRAANVLRDLAKMGRVNWRIGYMEP